MVGEAPDQASLNSELKRNIRKRFFQILIHFLLFSAILFISSDNLRWVWAWIYILMYVVYTIINSFLFSKELIAERGKTKENVKQWDKVLTKLAIIPGLATPLVAGLDERFHWQPDFSININIISLAFYILGNVIVSWSMISNEYFSTHVRIQTDREHKVATAGPYRYVRHPGYVGMILNTLFTPLMLGSFWALIPGLLMVIFFVTRTALEDRTLQQELEGYSEYVKQVKFKLVPGIW